MAKEYSIVPPKVEYRLTALGVTLRDPLRALTTWSVTHAAEVLAAREKHFAQPS